MKPPVCRWSAVAVVAGLAVFAGGPTAAALGWQRVSTYPGPAPYVLHVAAGDLDGDGADELVLVGRDYERQEDRLHVWGCRQPSPGSTSPCPLEPRVLGPTSKGPLGHVALAVADLLGAGRAQVLVAMDSRVELWSLHPGGSLGLVWQGEYGTSVEQLAPLRLPGIRGAVAMAAVRTRPRWEKRLEVAGWTGSGFTKLWDGVPVGPMRSLAAADLVGDGQSELVMDVGSGNDAGQAQVWRWDGQAFVRAGAQRLRDAPVFALAAAAVGGPGAAQLVLVADDRGRVSLYRWGSQGFVRVGDGETLGWSLVSAAVGDFDGDGTPEAVVVEYPNLVHMLGWRP